MAAGSQRSNARKKPPNAALVLGIRLAARTLVRELGFLSKHLASTDLTPSQVHALLELERAPTTQASDLRNLFRLNKSVISRLLADLQTRGFIRTTISKNDGRQRTLILTRKGKLQLTDIHHKANRQVNAALQAIDKREWNSVLKDLHLFADALAKTRGRGVPNPDMRSPRIV